MDENSCVAMYRSHEQTEAAVCQLLNAAFDIKKISIVGKGYQQKEHPAGYHNSSDQPEPNRVQSGFLGGNRELPGGSALFRVPGLDPVVMVGPLAAVLEEAVVVGGLSALGIALYNIGIPKDSIIRYESALESDQYLVVVHGNQQQLEQAHEVLMATEPTDIAIHLT